MMSDFQTSLDLMERKVRRRFKLATKNVPREFKGAVTQAFVQNLEQVVPTLCAEIISKMNF
jgi:hypothetical protein